MSAIDDTAALIEFVLEFFKDKIFADKDQYFATLSALCVNYKGLTNDELQKIAGFDQCSFSVFALLFKAVCVNYRGYRKIICPMFITLYLRKYLSTQEQKVQIYKKISAALEQNGPSLRNLEEQTNSLYMAGEFFQLK